MDTSRQILHLFHQNKGYARTRDILQAGLHHQYLKSLVESGQVVRIKRGLYRLADINIQDDLVEVSRMIPGGVVCLFSAWNFYQLSDFVPPEHHIAIHKSRKVVLPDYPPIKLYYWSEKYWGTGIAQAYVGDTPIVIYEREKSVCDAIRFRNKIGKEAEKEVLKNYLNLRDRNIDKLLHFARLMRVEQLMKSYLAILL